MRCGKLNEGTTSVEKLRNGNLETVIMCWLVFTLFLWQLLLATGPGKPVICLNFIAVVYPPLSPVRPHLILSHCMGLGAYTRSMQPLSGELESPSYGHQVFPGGWKQQWPG